MTDREIKAGSVVRYYQPGIDGILSSWAGSRTRVVGDSGSLETVTVTKVSNDGTMNYYETDSGVLLTDTDIREVIS